MESYTIHGRKEGEKMKKRRKIIERDEKGRRVIYATTRRDSVMIGILTILSFSLLIIGLGTNLKLTLLAVVISIVFGSIWGYRVDVNIKRAEETKNE